MSDVAAAALDGETPVNPYSLLEAVNSASDTVHTAWLIFLGVMSYLLITAAGVTHRDLLLNNEIPLPILQVKIDLTRFFLFAPMLLVLFHTGVVAQLVLLARKTLEFDRAIRLLEPTERRNHPLRLETNNFFFVQGIAGPDRSPVMGLFLHGMSWLTLVFLPVLILLYIQVVFLPYHSVAITTAHRVMLLADIVMLAIIGAFLARPENSFRSAFGRTLRRHPTTAVVTAGIFGVVSLFSLFVATIPGERLDRITDTIRGRTLPAADGSRPETAGAFGFSIPFLKPTADGSLFGLFYRNLVVTDTDMVIDSQVTPGEPTWSLRGRDLRFARLDRSDLHQMDFTGADLEGASFANADLRNVVMGCADLDRLLLDEDRRAARCTDARGANFARARLTEARFAGADLAGATFEHATLDGADLSYVSAPDANFTAASLRRADVTGGAILYGANFLTANLQGSDFTGARLILADLRSASLQGVVMAHARLEGAKLNDAELDGADLQSTRLASADFTGARVPAADFRGAVVWRTKPPEADPQGLADFSPLTARPPDQLDISSLRDILGKVETTRLRQRMTEGLSDVMEPGSPTAWAASPEAQTWGTLQVAAAAGQDGNRQRLTEGLSRIACRALWANGAVAVGVAKRAMRPAFKGDLPGLYARIRSTDCPASRNIPASFLTEFGNAADVARGQ
jgi:uncharacterized protein YjbI with pentapeptide repeats